MANDNGNSQEQPKRQAQEIIDRIIRLSAGETMEHIEANPKPKHEATPREQAAVDALLSSPDELPRYTSGGPLNIICFDHPSQEVAGAVVMQAFGVTDQRMFNGLIRQLVNAVSKGNKIDADELNAAVAMVAGIAPRDPLEAMLAVQMVAVQFSSMRHTRSMLTCDTIDQLDIQERVVNKLMRTFTTQMEALRKHRNGGNQKVVVEHVHVHSGGQAIVGNVTHGGRGGKQKAVQSHEQQDLSLPTRAAVLGYVETDQVQMPGPSGARQVSVPVPRRAGRGAKG
ncbi:hypothetical protein DXM26_20575 [Agrobacterium tumefaciens]|uniref:hypothetical protein n=1 Tax=Agrobacterium tumefaciens TaxID=358 RepID=UPI00122FD6AE|nr:hypothetical protein DXM26_20575 [Agrobacterium tumefaciens]